MIDRIAPRRPSSPTLDAALDRVARAPYIQRRRWVAGQRYPRFLYKYRKLAPGDAKSIEHMRDVIVRSRLWLSSPSDFNDPFDMSARVVIKGSDAEMEDRFIRLFHVHSSEPEAEQREKVKAILARRREEVLRELAEVFERSLGATGVYAFAGDPRSILMWSHYGADHEGVCLQFEIARDTSTLLHVLEVEYVEAYPELNWLDDAPERFTSILRKFRAWKYEMEQRIIVPEGAHSYLPVQPEALTGIIVGCRASDATHARLDQLLSERHIQGHPAIRVYVAAKHGSRYGLVIKRR